MNRYNKYNIRETDRFDSNDFPKVQLEIEDMLKATEGIASANKDQVIITYLRDHLLEKGSENNNPELTRLLTEGHFVITHIEALFESSRANKDFQRGFEDYIRESLAEHTIKS